MKHSMLYGEAVLLILTGLIEGTAQASQWWGDPVVKYKEAAADLTAPHYMNKDESDQFLFVPGSTVNSLTAYLYSIPDLIAASSSNGVAPVFADKSTSFHSLPWKGGAISDELRRIVTGNGNGSYVASSSMVNSSLPVSGPWTKDVTVFAITNLPVDVQFDGPDFSHNSDYLYGACYLTGHQHQFIKFNVVDLAHGGNGLTSNALYNTSVSRVRCVNAYYIGGKDLVYYGEGTSGASAKVCVFDSVTETETVLTNGFADGTIASDVMNVKVSGVGLGGQMYLYVQCNDGSLNVYELAADGLSVGRLVRALTSSQMKALLGVTTISNMRSFEVTNDGKYAFITFHSAGGLYVVYNRPRPVITWWRNPHVKYKEPVQTGGPHYMNKDESDQYLFYPSHSSSATAINYLFSIETLTGAESSDGVAPMFSSPSSTFHSIPWKGGAVSDDMRRIVTGHGFSGTIGVNSLPVAAPWTKDVTVFAVTNVPSDVQFDGPDFSHDSAYLYAAYYNTGHQYQIYKFNVVDLAHAGNGITSNAVYDTTVTRVRSVSAYYIGGKDLLYYGEGALVASAKVCVFDTVSETETVLTNGYADGSITSEIMNVKVSGVGLGGQMYLYVQCENGALNIYELAANGMSVGRLVHSFTRAQMYALLGAAPVANMRCFEVTNDGRYAFVTFHGANCLNVLWTPPSSLNGTVLMLRP